MLNPRSSGLLALTVLALLTACGKQQPPAEKAPAPEATATAGDTASVPHPEPSAVPGAMVDFSGIAKAEGGKTVAEIFAEKAQLAGTEVTFRGKVVKTNPEIMGKNWLHVQDGTGALNSNDLTITTSAELPNVGDTVLVTGKVALDQDFGLGYQYPIIIEEAQVVVE